MFIKLFLAVAITSTILINLCKSAPITITYDERQNGTYNIRLSIKEVSFITIDEKALDDENDDDLEYEDYDYDIDQLTVNPFYGLFGTGSAKPTVKPIVSAPPCSTVKPPLTTTKIDKLSSITESTTVPTSPQTPKIDSVQDLKVTSEQPAVITSATSELSSESSTTAISTPAFNQSTTSNSPTYDRKKITTAPTVVIIKGSGSTAIPNMLTEQNLQNDEIYKYGLQNMQQIPVQVVIEPMVKPKIRANHKNNHILNRLRLFNKHQSSVEVLGTEHDIHPQSTVRDSTKCSEGRFMDKSGRCRVHRSVLSHLLTMLLQKNIEKI